MRFPETPDRDALSKAFGFPVPRELARTIDALYQSTESPKQAELLFEHLLGILPGGPELRYDTTPAELFPIGTTGGDGEHYGCVVLAPELGLDDYPMVSFIPGESSPVRLIGATTRAAIERVVSNRELDMEVAGMRAAVDRLGLDAVEKQPPVWGSGENRVLEPDVPEGWRFEATPDGVGVLAPAEKFRLGPRAWDPMAPAVAYIRYAETALAEGYPASALCALKHGMWRLGFGDDALDFVNGAIQCYYELERPLHGDAMLAHWQRSALA